MPYTAVSELAYSRWDKVRSNPNLFNAEGFAGCSAAAAGFSCATKDYFGVSFLFAPRILQVIPGGDLTIPMFVQGGIKGNAATLSGGNQEAGNYSLGLSSTISRSTLRPELQRLLRQVRDNGSIVTVGNGPLYRDRGLLTFTFRTSSDVAGDTMSKMSKIAMAVALVGASLANTATAAVSADEAKALGTTLTAFGAEKAANKDGTIPAYSGGLTTPPAGFKKGGGTAADPFAGEKPLFSIDAKNMEQHADKLTEASKAMMQKYPDYRIDVYPTHRSVAFPKCVLDNTAKNATRARPSRTARLDGRPRRHPVPDPEDRRRGDVEPPAALQRPGLRLPREDLLRRQLGPR